MSKESQMKMTPRGEELLEQIVELPKLDRTILLEQLLLMQQGQPEIAIDTLLAHQHQNSRQAQTHDCSPVASVLVH
jgi:hypothetical protein